jgi:hypothetical protein
MTTIPPSDDHGKPPIKEAARELFRHKSLLERLGPVLVEFQRTINSESTTGQQHLPSYCYNILKILRKIYLKILPASEQLAVSGSKEPDWDSLGKMVGAGLRCLSFSQIDREEILGRECLPEKEMAGFRGMIATIYALLGSDSVEWSESPVANRPDNRTVQVWDAFLAYDQSACRSGAWPLLHLNSAIDKGLRGFHRKTRLL